MPYSQHLVGLSRGAAIVAATLLSSCPSCRGVLRALAGAGHTPACSLHPSNNFDDRYSNPLLNVIANRLSAGNGLDLAGIAVVLDDEDAVWGRHVGPLLDQIDAAVEPTRLTASPPDSPILNGIADTLADRGYDLNDIYVALAQTYWAGDVALLLSALTAEIRTATAPDRRPPAAEHRQEAIDAVKRIYGIQAREASRAIDGDRSGLPADHRWAGSHASLWIEMAVDAAPGPVTTTNVQRLLTFLIDPDRYGAQAGDDALLYVTGTSMRITLERHDDWSALTYGSGRVVGTGLPADGDRYPLRAARKIITAADDLIENR